MRTFADGSDLAHDVETRHVRERAWADAVQTPGEELPVDGVDRRKRHSYLHLARARGGDLDIRELEVGDGVRGKDVVWLDDEGGEEAGEGEIERAFAALNPASPNGVIPASAPPVIIISASP